MHIGVGNALVGVGVTKPAGDTSAVLAAPFDDGARDICSTSDSLMVPDTTGHFFASEACRCAASANSVITKPKAPNATTGSRYLGMPKPGRDQLGQSMQADRRAEHDRQRDRGGDAEAAPQTLRQIALQHRLARMARIVIDGDGGADRITRKSFRDLEIAEVFADADAVVAQRLAADGIFVDDIGEVALLEPVSASRGRCRITLTSRTSAAEITTLPGVEGQSRAARTCSVL